MILLILFCFAAAFWVSCWAQTAYAAMTRVCAGRQPCELPVTEKRMAGRHFMASQFYTLLALALAVVAGLALGRGL